MTSHFPPDASSLIPSHERNSPAPIARDFGLDHHDNTATYDHHPHSLHGYDKENIEELAFQKFVVTINNFDSKLDRFSTEARKVGRSFGILIAAQKLREQLARMAFICHENAAHLFPRFESHQRQGHIRHNATSYLTKNAAIKRLSLDRVPDQMKAFASTLEDFHARLDEFQEYHDGSIKIKASIKLFEGDLKYWASCLRSHESPLDSAPIRKYIFQLTIELGDRIAQIIPNLIVFIEIGMPAIQYEQKRDSKRLLNMSTGATFFSAVTATMLQISYSVDRKRLILVVNTLWFCSLALSIGAALNSLLAMVWKQTIYGSRGRSLPLWVTVCIQASPPVFFVLSIVCFSIGLILFAYASGQGPFTSISTLVATVITSLGLAVTALWMAYEQLWALIQSPPKEALRSWRDHTTLVRHSGQLFGTNYTESTVSASLSSGASAFEDLGLEEGSSYGGDGSDDEDGSEAGIGHSRFLLRASSQARTIFNFINASDVTQDVEMQRTASGRPKSQSLWKTVASAVERHRFPFTTSQRQHVSEGETDPVVSTPATAILAPATDDEISATMSRFISIPEYGVLQHLRYSPDGNYLATTGCVAKNGQSTTIIFDVAGGRLNRLSTYDHFAYGSSGQVVWSFDSKILLIRLRQTVHVWRWCESSDGEQHQPIHRPHSIQSIRWWMQEEAFLSIERNTIVKLNLNKNRPVEWKQPFPNMRLIDVAIISESSRLVVLGRVIESMDGFHPSLSSAAEKQILVLDANSRQCLFRVPILDDARHVTPTQNGSGVLIGYGSKCQPQLWALKAVGESKTTAATTVEIELKRTYTPEHEYADELVGPSYPGNDDKLVLCTAKCGDVHIWNPESGLQIHRFRAHNVEGRHGSPCSSWCPSSNSAFATGYENELKIWKFNHSPTTPRHLRQTMVEEINDDC